MDNYPGAMPRISVAVSVAAWRDAPVSRCVEYFRDEHARRDYRNMRVKRTLPPRTTVVKHEGATEGERIEHSARRREGGRETVVMLERGWRMLALVVAEVATKGTGPGVDRERERCIASEEGEKHG